MFYLGINFHIILIINQKINWGKHQEFEPWVVLNINLIKVSTHASCNNSNRDFKPKDFSNKKIKKDNIQVVISCKCHFKRHEN